MKSTKSGAAWAAWEPGGPQDPPVRRSQAQGDGASNHTKTEFVIVFFWKEPTPSDIHRGEDPNAKPPAPPTAGPTMGQPNRASPMGQPPMGPPPGEDKPLSPRGDLGP